MVSADSPREWLSRRLRGPNIGPRHHPTLQDSDAHTYDCVAALSLVRVGFGDILGCNTDLELHRIEQTDVQHCPSTL
jgi:hypothetical protein